MTLAELIRSNREAILDAAADVDAGDDADELTGVVGELCEALRSCDEARGPRSRRRRSDGHGRDGRDGELRRLTRLHQAVLEWAERTGYRPGPAEQRLLLDALLASASRDEGPSPFGSRRALQEALLRYAFIVHDLRGLVQGADLAAAVVRQHVRPDMPGMHQLEDQLRGLKDRMADVVLAWRVEEDAAPSLQPLGLAQLADRIVAERSASAARRRLELRSRVSSEVQVRADEALLKAALRNLVDNALRYSRPETTVELLAHVDGERVRLEINDGCRGFPAGTRRGDEQGLGLGLRIARRVAALHGGTVTRRDRPGGCTFSLTLLRDGVSAGTAA